MTCKVQILKVSFWCRSNGSCEEWAIAPERGFFLCALSLSCHSFEISELICKTQERAAYEGTSQSLSKKTACAYSVWTIFFSFCSYMYNFLHPPHNEPCHFIFLLKWQWKTGLSVNVIEGWLYFVTASICLSSPKRDILIKAVLGDFHSK